MRSKSVSAFISCIDSCITRNVDFLVISGDLFNTALPPIDLMKQAVEQLIRLREAAIPVYLIAGSHDYSVSGKTMLDVLEKTGLFTNVMRGHVDEAHAVHLDPVVDEKTGCLITGILGKAGMLDKHYYESLARVPLQQRITAHKGPSIFLFHTAIREYLPSRMGRMEALPLSFLPKGFDYYAGGHVHYRFERREDRYGRIAYPGPLFPANFAELEELGCGSFIMVENDSIEWIKVAPNTHVPIVCDITGKSAAHIREELMRKAEASNLTDAIVTLRLKGHLHDGFLRDIGLPDVIDSLYEKGAYFVMKNSASVKIDAFDAVSVDVTNKDSIERELIEEHCQKNPLKLVHDQKHFIHRMMDTLASCRHEAEKVGDFETRLTENIADLIEKGTDESGNRPRLTVINQES